MSEPHLQINISNSDYNDEDLVEIRFRDGNFVKINLIKLFVQSKYFRNKYNYSEIISSIQDEIKKIEDKFHFSGEIIKFFFQLIQEEKVNIPLKHYKDFYILSEHLCTQKITAQLDNISQQELLNDLNFTIQVLLDSNATKSSLETKLTSNIESFLIERVNDCIMNSKFGKLPISTICRIFDKSKEIVNHDLLVDFILESASTRFILFKYVELHKMKDDKVKELIEFIEKQEKETKKIYVEYMPFNILFIKSVINKYNEVISEYNKAKEELKDEKIRHEQTKEELKDEKIRHEQTKEELKNEKIKHEQTKEKMIPKLRESNILKDDSKLFIMPFRLHIKICEARKVLKMYLGGKSDPYVTLRLKSQGKKDVQKTRTINNTTDPIWNQEFDIIAYTNDVLFINMYNEDIKNDEKMMDELQFPVNTWQIGSPLDRKELDVKLRKKIAGTFIFEVQAFAGYDLDSKNSSNLDNPKGCKVRIKAFDAKDVLAMHARDTSNPYLEFGIKDKQHASVATYVDENTRNPFWNQNLEVASSDYKSDVLEIKMFDKDYNGDEDEMMDTILIPLCYHQIGKHYVFDDNIKYKKKNAGHLHFELDFLPAD